MPTALALRTDYDSDALRNIARCSKNSSQIRRLLSIAAVYDGMNRTEAAGIGGMDRQALRRRLSNEQLVELSTIVETGPDVQTDGVVRWRRVDLQVVIEQR